MSDWFANTPKQISDFMEKGNVWGRAQFAKSYASGGAAATIFAPTRKDMLLAPWRSRHSVGGAEYNRRLMELGKDYKSGSSGSKSIAKALQAGKKARIAGTSRMVGGIAGTGLGAAMIVMPAFTTEGDAKEKARAVSSGAAGLVGWWAGAKVGAGVGTAVGSYLGPVGAAAGFAIGAIAGGLVGSGVAEKVADTATRIPDKMVEKERAKRRLNWGQHTAAFQTQRAATMRQQSLMMMNRGQMSSRSLMGQEATFVHR